MSGRGGVGGLRDALPTLEKCTALAPGKRCFREPECSGRSRHGQGQEPPVCCCPDLAGGSVAGAGDLQANGGDKGGALVGELRRETVGCGTWGLRTLHQLPAPSAGPAHGDIPTHTPGVPGEGHSQRAVPRGLQASAPRTTLVRPAGLNRRPEAVTGPPGGLQARKASWRKWGKSPVEGCVVLCWGTVVGCVVSCPKFLC